MPGNLWAGSLASPPPKQALSCFSPPHSAAIWTLRESYSEVEQHLTTLCTGHPKSGPVSLRLTLGGEGVVLGVGGQSRHLPSAAKCVSPAPLGAPPWCGSRGVHLLPP